MGVVRVTDPLETWAAARVVAPAVSFGQYAGPGIYGFGAIRLHFGQQTPVTEGRGNVRTGDEDASVRY